MFKSAILLLLAIILHDCQKGNVRLTGTQQDTRQTMGVTHGLLKGVQLPQ